MTVADLSARRIAQHRTRLRELRAVRRRLSGESWIGRGPRIARGGLTAEYVSARDGFRAMLLRSDPPVAAFGAAFRAAQIAMRTLDRLAILPEIPYV